MWCECASFEVIQWHGITPQWLTLNCYYQLVNTDLAIYLRNSCSPAFAQLSCSLHWGSLDNQNKFTVEWRWISQRPVVYVNNLNTLKRIIQECKLMLVQYRHLPQQMCHIPTASSALKMRLQWYQQTLSHVYLTCDSTWIISYSGLSCTQQCTASWTVYYFSYSPVWLMPQAELRVIWVKPYCSYSIPQNVRPILLTGQCGDFHHGGSLS